MNYNTAEMFARQYIRRNTKGKTEGEGIVVVRDCGKVITYHSLTRACREHGSYIFQWTLKDGKIELIEE